jgi:hypothetical protein
MPNEKHEDPESDFVRGLADNGQLVVAGWAAFRTLFLKGDLPESTSDMYRDAFFAGALYLFESVVKILEDRDETTADNERRLKNIGRELIEFQNLMQLKYGAVAGKG